RRGGGAAPQGGPRGGGAPRAPGGRRGGPGRRNPRGPATTNPNKRRGESNKEKPGGRGGRGAARPPPHHKSTPRRRPPHARPPAAKALRGVFITGTYAGIYWPAILEKVAARKNMNAVVLDGKDYDGPVNYPTKAKIAVEIEATPKDPPIPDLARAIRFAHWKNL